ncbi:MAG: hypothetical protein A3C80_03705 [Candidatus Ryanbacteria bacterium RIFCSPHIGHO2_02_FULL_45_43]|uniref:NTP pyrophosphohydrolase MazG putative catalytic core domain-containing protein n=1 Tax=Candidatus Ryanbacteria bacterium RIFCSPHIGHO2_01_45_13 TaxID=1802112 RepID=A0A1G2FYJ5_9BACT|nr:MAG: hypothetical protein A2718_02965 [Candidatus Ryanbacteria bacterium RIFCSPHIGHO2_01_FULL_44_130]OGZ43143.1 MAG: hypothetical protein A2W41_00410 [Candidatus Ryanbacteria bacterium RIFCSPHIGHO2_01_45_13]OGZ47782.1 MAG: hypothetical protein A3C80_03705 [Candidatus Ryanbacteria bacterium RIFCSPHIGHO2_02_FULL_45_43]OGZ49675.1 MAG: hypothetical protein A3E55_02160 [Candidatus Ryanbacteria bacterium RIFCSPHIGHO2_12_FULL_44_20]OGZ52168.1 MAG: hypothetical protein A3A17_03025 [Candidatus Ryanba
MAQLSEMLSAVNQHWNINDLKRVYPHLSRKPRSRHQAECVKQISLHFAEACERLAEACEEVGHGNVLNVHKVQEALQRFLVSTLQLANVLGCGDRDLEFLLKEWVKKRAVLPDVR